MHRRTGQVGQTPGKVRDNSARALVVSVLMSDAVAEERPTPEALAADLAALLRTGVTIDGCRRSPALLALALVRAKASSGDPNDLAVAAHHLVREACASVDSLSEGPTAVLLAVAPGYRGTLLKKRRTDAAAKLFISAGHLRDEREEPLLEAVADELYAVDSAYRLRHRHRIEAEREPPDSRLQIDWYEQHRRYGRLWTPLVALRADLLVLVGWIREIRAEALRANPAAPGDVLVVDSDTGAPDRTPEEAGTVGGVRVDTEWWRHCNERCAQMTWRLAQHSRQWVAFVERDGGLFLMADAESEVRAVDALYRAGVLHLPFGDANVSWFRRLLADTPHQELDVFMERLLADDERWPPNFAKWLSWATDLIDSGDLSGVPAADQGTFMAEREEDVPLTITPAAADEPKSVCGLWLAAAEELITLVEADWFGVADWYRGRACDVAAPCARRLHVGGALRSKQLAHKIRLLLHRLQHLAKRCYRGPMCGVRANRRLAHRRCLRAKSVALHRHNLIAWSTDCFDARHTLGEQRYVARQFAQRLTVSAPQRRRQGVRI